MALENHIGDSGANPSGSLHVERRRNMVPQRCIIVEDEYLVALDVEAVLQSIGVETITIATTLAQAQDALGRDGADCVLLDVSLSDGKSYDLPATCAITEFPSVSSAVMATRVVFPTISCMRPCWASLSVKTKSPIS